MKIRLKDNRLKIMQITDTHFGNEPFHEDDYKTFRLLDKVITEQKPDLIIHTGDLMWSDGVKNCPGIYEKVLKKLDQFKIPLAITFGNHEAENTTTKDEYRQIYEKIVEKKVKKTNVFNFNDKEAYTIEVFDDKDEIVNILYVIDSGIIDKDGYGEYDYNDPEHVEWFREVSKKYKKNDGIKRNIVFQHIPLMEYEQGKLNILEGGCHEHNATISSPKINTGLFSNMLLNGETWGITVGHDHDNNFDSIYNGIHLVYGQVSGYQAYGFFKRGCRIFEITKSPFSIETYRVEVDV